MQTHLDSYENLSGFVATAVGLHGSFISLKGTLLDRCGTSCLYGLLGGHMYVVMRAGGKQA